MVNGMCARNVSLFIPRRCSPNTRNRSYLGSRITTNSKVPNSGVVGMGERTYVQRGTSLSLLLESWTFAHA